MLNFIYWPVSWLMRLWYKFFELLGLGSQNPITWILAVLFLVFTLRLILYWPAMKQLRTTRKMQELQPQIKALQKKYKNDRQRLATEMQKLQKEHGFNPMLGCLPMLAQAPMFIGLYHVLRSFNRTGGFGRVVNVCEGISDPTKCANFNASISNYAFTPEDVSNFLHTSLFGVPLSSYIIQPASVAKGFFVEDPSRLHIAAVAIPLMIVAAIATHLNARVSVARQSSSAASGTQAKIMNKLALYVFPLGLMVSGAFLPIAILIYWVGNNGWTVMQNHLVHKQIAKEEEQKSERLEEVRAERAPKPGAKPSQGKKGSAARNVTAGTTVVEGDVADDGAGEPDDGAPDDGGLSSGSRRTGSSGKAKSGGSGSSGSASAKSKSGSGKTNAGKTSPSGGSSGQKKSGGQAERQRSGSSGSQKSKSQKSNAQRAQNREGQRSKGAQPKGQRSASQGSQRRNDSGQGDGEAANRRADRQGQGQRSSSKKSGGQGSSGGAGGGQGRPRQSSKRSGGGGAAPGGNGRGRGSQKSGGDDGNDGKSGGGKKRR